MSTGLASYPAIFNATKFNRIKMIEIGGKTYNLVASPTGVPQIQND
jgi:hypothetical protein